MGFGHTSEAMMERARTDAIIPREMLIGIL